MAFMESKYITKIQHSLLQYTIVNQKFWAIWMYLKHCYKANFNAKRTKVIEIVEFSLYTFV